MIYYRDLFVAFVLLVLLVMFCFSKRFQEWWGSWELLYRVVFMGSATAVIALAIIIIHR